MPATVINSVRPGGRAAEQGDDPVQCAGVRRVGDGGPERPARRGAGLVVGDLLGEVEHRLGDHVVEPERQVDYLLAREFAAEFYLTQIVSHHSRQQVEDFLGEAQKRGLTIPGMFGVFYYRSANARTLAALSGFLPVPAGELTAEFNAGATAEEICARSIRTLSSAGVRHFYISNLPVNRAAHTLQRILDLAGAPAVNVER